MNKRHLLRATAFVLTSLMGAGLAQAQTPTFPPAKPITLVVGFAPGGAADAAARLIAKKLGENIGQTVLVENKAGAGGNIAHQQVAAGPGDGTEMLHVPYRGGAPAMNDLLAGRFTGYFSAPPTSLPHVEAGKLIPLATTGLTRPAYMPNIPTVAESGLPGFEALNWYAFVMSSKVPVALLDRYNVEIVKVLNDAGVRDALTKHGLSAHPTTRAELTDFMQKESVKWEKIVRERNVKPE